MTANNDDDGIEIIGGDPRGAMEDDADGKSLTDLVEQPAKVMRIGTMIKQLLEEVRAAPLDDASRNRLREIHRTSIASSRTAWRPSCATSSNASRCRSPRTGSRPTPSFGSRRRSWSAGWKGFSTVSRQRCSPSRWPRGSSWSRCAAARAHCPQVSSADHAAAPGPASTSRSRLVAPHIETRNAWVEFPIFDAKARSLKKAFLGKAGGAIGRNESNVVVIEALRDITMSLELGDRVGLVGHNGAGKSTLLRLLSGIYEPTRGVATVTGRVAPVFDLGVGMDPEISGFENILIRGLFLGQTRKQMLAKVDEIAEFTELGDYLSMPLRTYSTGMRVRLAMGVVTSIDPEILLLDEGIGAVDAEFLKKAQSRLQSLVERSGILVFASHSNEFLARLCKTAMWIDHGTIKMTGGIEDVVRAYEGPDAARHVREVLEESRRESVPHD